MDSLQPRRHLITSALPYANGPLHFGHLSGVYLPADIYRRHRTLQGHETLHVCGSDEHGVAIMISAEKQGVGYQAYVDGWHKAHRELFDRFDIEFDVFGRTSDPYHATEVVEWFRRLYDAGLISQKIEKQLYSIDDNKFLPDRYVEGTCYVCSFQAARGDECPNCGEWIDAIRLINPVSKISGSRNIEVREVEHYYLLLSKMDSQFREWFASKEPKWRNIVTGFVKGLLEQGLIDRAISRDLVWGIDVPRPDAQGKKLYVWFDAPIGYVSILKEHLRRTGRDSEFDKWWNSEDVEISHFIGKDNIIFHAVIWPCMILGSGLVRTPTNIPANQFVNLEGRQFSKSAGWYVDANEALKQVGVNALRFYLCSLIPENGDSNFSWDSFKIAHGDLSNKVGNLAHRTLTFVQKNWPDGISATIFNKLAVSAELKEVGDKHAKALSELDGCHFGKALQEILAIGNKGNEFFHVVQPWVQIKTDREAAAQSCATALVILGTLGLLLQPLVPDLGRRILAHFGLENGSEDLVRSLYLSGPSALVRELGSSGFCSKVPVEVLVPRIEDDVIAQLKLEMTIK